MAVTMERAPERALEQPARGWRNIWTPARARLWLPAAAVAAFLPALGVPLRGWLDFGAFYAAGALAFTPDVARLGPVVAYQAAHGIPITPFVYPAGLALLYVPFAWLPYGIAGALHLVLTLGCLIAAAAWGAALLGLPRRWAIVGALAWGPAAAGVVSGQNTSLALLLVVATAAALLRGRDAAGGIATGLLAYKPQLAAPIAGLLLLRARWAALVAFIAMVGAQYLLGMVATGGNLAWPRDWFDTLATYTNADFHANGWQAVSLPALATRMELVTGIGWLTAAGYLAAAAIVVVCIPALRRWTILDAVALASACGLAISPHAWVYDATLLLPALGVLAARAASRGWPWQDRWLIAAAYAIGLTWPLGGFVGITLVPLLVVAAPLILLRDGQIGRGAQAGESEATGSFDPAAS
jgi:Glycosyltransferase family 87